VCGLPARRAPSQEMGEQRDTTLAGRLSLDGEAFLFSDRKLQIISHSNGGQLNHRQRERERLGLKVGPSHSCKHTSGQLWRNATPRAAFNIGLSLGPAVDLPPPLVLSSFQWLVQANRLGPKKAKSELWKSALSCHMDDCLRDVKHGPRSISKIALDGLCNKCL